MKDYGSQKALTASLRPTGTMSRSNTKVSGTNGVLSGSKNGKNYVLDRSKSTGNGTYKKGNSSRGNNFKFGSNSKNHLKNVEAVNTKKGVVGGHNMDDFNNALKDQGFNPEDLIVSKKNTPNY